MRANEIFGEHWQQIDEVKPTGSEKPLTPTQARARSKKKEAANAKVKDTRYAAMTKINTAVRAANNI